VVIHCQQKSADEPARERRSPPLPSFDDGQDGTAALTT